jgi:hypothetical protein
MRRNGSRMPRSAECKGLRPERVRRPLVAVLRVVAEVVRGGRVVLVVEVVRVLPEAREVPEVVALQAVRIRMLRLAWAAAAWRIRGR